MSIFSDAVSSLLFLELVLVELRQEGCMLNRNYLYPALFVASWFLVMAKPTAARAVSTSGVSGGSLLCANVFRTVPQELHPIIYTRQKNDERIGVRRFDEAAQRLNRVSVVGGLLFYKGRLLDTSAGTADGDHRRGIQILALDSEMNLITTEHAPADIVHHSTLTGGRPGFFFGEWRVRQGKVIMASNMSGHFLPTVEQLYVFVDFLTQLGVLHPDFEMVEIFPNPIID